MSEEIFKIKFSMGLGWGGMYLRWIFVLLIDLFVLNFLLCEKKMGRMYLLSHRFPNFWGCGTQIHSPIVEVMNWNKK